MVLFRVTDGKFVRVFSLGLLLLVLTARVSRQQADVSLRFLGETIPNDSFVDIDDVLNVGGRPLPSNREPAIANASLQCITDLVDCCGTESGSPTRTERGNWYFPDGTTVGFGSGARFLVNRGPNEAINGEQIYGSVRLFRRFSGVTERGRFHCELPSVANPIVNQIIYVNILNFAFRFDDPHIIISSSGSNTAGTVYSLTCSSTLNSDSIPLPANVLVPPTFMWSFDPSGSDPLPSGVTDMGTTSSDNITFTSTLQFSPLSQCHIGSYTCRLGPGRLVTSTMITVNGLSPIAVSVEITTSGAKVLGQSGYSLTCGVTVTGTANPSIAYQWTKNNGTQTQVGTDRVLSFSPLRLSDAGRYTCQATVNPCSIIEMDTQDVTLQIPAPTSVSLSSSIPNPIPPFSGSDVTLTCAVELSPAVDVSVTVNTALTTPDGFTRIRTAQPVVGSSTNYAAEFVISSFGRSNSGLYICTATVSLPSNAYVSDSSAASHALRATTGVYLALSDLHIANNSNVNIQNIGQFSNGALQCITDNPRCCSQNPLGEWYQPNKALVQGTTSTTAFYRTRGANGEVSLNRPSDVESPTGQFCCEVPDATSTNQTLCVNIGLYVTASGSPIAGESYTLECSAGGSEGTFQWLKGPPDGRTPVVENSPRVTITSNAASSQLQFRPVQQSDNGSYTCSATIDGSTSFSDSLNVIINAPPVSFQLRGGGATPTAGQNYQLTCSILGSENLNPTITYRWTRNSGSGQTQVGANSNTLSFTPLRLADAASYVCGVTVSSSYLANDIMVVNSFDVRIQFPSPSSITLVSSDHSSRPNSLPILGSDVTLTCTLELNSDLVASEILLLMVNVQLLRDGTPLTLTGPTIRDTTFTYTRQFESFGRSDSGNYTCKASIGPVLALTYITGNETLSTTVNIKAASAPPVNVVATQSGSSAPVEVSWSPPSDGDNIITGYRIFYGNGKNASIPAVATSIGLRVDGNYIGENISVRSEADQLYSELISTSVTVDNSQLLSAGCAEMQCSCSSEIGITIGVIIVAECLVVMVITISVVLYLWRKRSTLKNTDNNKNIAVSANMAYGEVTLKPAGMMTMEGEYENPDKILKPSGQRNEATAASNYETIDTSKQPTMEQSC